MPRRGTSVIIDVNESVKQLENELRILTTQKQNLLANIKELESKRDSLNKEMSNLSEKIQKIEKETKAEADRITDIAKEKMEKANIRESESVEKQVELNRKIKDGENLIKSNEGLQRNLNLQTEAVKERIKKIDDFVDLIKINSKDI